MALTRGLPRSRNGNRFVANHQKFRIVGPEVHVAGRFAGSEWKGQASRAIGSGSIRVTQCFCGTRPPGGASATKPVFITYRMFFFPSFAPMEKQTTSVT